MTKLVTLLILLPIVSLCASSPVDSEESSKNYYTYQVDNPDDESNIEITFENVGVCQAAECHLLGVAFSKAMNKSVDPCNDFYEFACGNWKVKKVVMNYEVEMNMFKAFQTVIEEDMRDLLQQEANPNDALPLRKTKKWYRSCINQKKREQRGIKTVEYLFHTIGDWPLLIKAEEWNKNEWTLQSIVDYYLDLIGEHPFIRVLPMRLSQNDNTGHILILPPALPLNDIIPTANRNYHGHDLKVYKSLLQRVARLFVSQRGQNVSDELNKDIDELIEFERKLYDAQHLAYDHYENVESASYDWIQNDASLQSVFSNLDSNIITQSNDESQDKIDLNNVIPRLFNLAGVIYDNSTKIILHNKNYHSAVSEILKSTSKRTIVNYIHWRFVSQLLPYTNDEANDIYTQYMKDGFDLVERPSRWRECIRGMKMNHVLGYSLIDKYKKRNVTKPIGTIAAGIKKAFKHTIERSNWLSPPAKRALKQKISALNTLPGIPDLHDTQKALNNYYKGLGIEHDYVENQIRSLRHQKIYAIRKFANGEDSSGWLTDPIANTALYIYRLNTFTIPGNNLLYPLFESNTPNYAHYGMIGNIIAHEMGHAFDETGILLTENYEMPLLKAPMHSKYNEQSQCFTDQLRGTFTKKNRGVQEQKLFTDLLDSNIRMKRDSYWEQSRPTSIAVSQRIADTIGLQAAFKAYKNKMHNLIGDSKLRNLENLSDQQMFFISYAGTLCEAATDKYHRYNTQSVQSYNLGKSRVNGAVSNSKAFAHAFSCPKGSPMNPEVKCDLWTKTRDITKENEIDFFSDLYS